MEHLDTVDVGDGSYESSVGLGGVSQSSHKWGSSARQTFLTVRTIEP